MTLFLYSGTIGSFRISLGDLDPVRLQEGGSLSQVSPNLDFWSDASDVGWGAHLGQEVASGKWSPEEASMSVIARELLAVERGLLHFQS